MASKKDYSAELKVLWRFVRVFMASFLVTLASSLQTVDEPSKAVFASILIGAATGALTALGKAVREYVASGDYTSLVHRLPF